MRTFDVDCIVAVTPHMGVFLIDVILVKKRRGRPSVPLI